MGWGEGNKRSNHVDWTQGLHGIRQEKASSSGKKWNSEKQRKQKPRQHPTRALDHLFLNLSQKAFKIKIGFQKQQVCGGDWECAFRMSSQVVWMQLVQESHLENRCSRSFCLFSFPSGALALILNTSHQILASVQYFCSLFLLERLRWSLMTMAGAIAAILHSWGEGRDNKRPSGLAILSC